ncbi:hypothetical protein G7078_10550 [Sphingomonas sinipercae]|uniref:Uncharacterized protein n=1 Tax=Sphingomonas sinipercae TaxID=2714944 RepID=A0A6G7ZQH7_9SPHN|nr:hypothetical protein [Sphingomonas sinipercae]QIL03172.1 hypothetical protein G7078_10550 [Sphingomonas sinipercae]
MTEGLLILAAAIAPASAAFDLAGKSALVAPTESGKCQAGAPNEVVVCGKREPNYRLDPAALATARARDALPAAPDPTAALANASPCSAGIGPQGCTGKADIDFVAVGLLAAKAAAAAAQGEDWRETFRTRPDEYNEYRAAKDRENRKRPHVTLGFGAGGGSGAPRQ